MKVWVLAIVAAAFVVMLWQDRPVVYKTPPAERFLKISEQNPPLKQIGDTWPIAPGTPVWFHPERSSFGIILDTEGDLAHFRSNAESDSSVWVNRRHIKKAWIPK